MKRKTFLLTSTLGLSSRTAAQLVYSVKASRSKVWIEEEGGKRDGRRILDLLDLTLHHRGKVTVVVEGEDEDAVMQQISELIGSERL
jgi:phosphotransferase system HPr (HPr) family protein